jgi:hypothetical protein
MLEENGLNEISLARARGYTLIVSEAEQVEYRYRNVLTKRICDSGICTKTLN